MTQMNLSTKQKQTHRHREQICQGEGGGEGMDWEFGVNRCKLVYTEWISNKVLLYSTGNYIQYPMINHNGKEYKKEYIYIKIISITYSSFPIFPSQILCTTYFIFLDNISLLHNLYIYLFTSCSP